VWDRACRIFTLLKIAAIEFYFFPTGQAVDFNFLEMCFLRFFPQNKTCRDFLFSERRSRRILLLRSYGTVDIVFFGKKKPLKCYCTIYRGVEFLFFWEWAVDINVFVEKPSTSLLVEVFSGFTFDGDKKSWSFPIEQFEVSVYFLFSRHKKSQNAFIRVKTRRLFIFLREYTVEFWLFYCYDVNGPSSFYFRRRSLRICILS
jgi:hypothetical protein